MIVIILVNWNGHIDTVECLEALMRLDTPGSAFRVIVSDNGSVPASVDHITAWCRGEVTVDRTTTAWRLLPAERRHKPDYRVIEHGASDSIVLAPMVTVLRNGANLGFAGGNNAAIRLALTDPSVDHIWLLNNDTICHPDALDRLAARMKVSPGLGLLGSTLVYYDNPTKVQGLAGWFDAWRGWGDHIGKFQHLDALPNREDVERQLNYVVGASMFVSRDFLIQIGLMEERYFLYFEEMDWSERNAGRFRFGWEPTSIVCHKEGASIGTSMRHRASNTSIYYSNRNLLIFTWRYHRAATPMIATRILARAARFVSQCDLDGAGIVLWACRDFLLGKEGRQPIPSRGSERP